MYIGGLTNMKCPTIGSLASTDPSQIQPIDWHGKGPALIAWYSLSTLGEVSAENPTLAKSIRI